MKRGRKIELDILKVIKSLKTPISTREICLKINRAWHTVDRHCLKLQLAGKIIGFKVGNVNAWVKKREVKKKKS